MNALYLLNVSGFGLSIFTSMVLWNRYTNMVKVKADTKNSGILESAYVLQYPECLQSLSGFFDCAICHSK